MNADSLQAFRIVAALLWAWCAYYMAKRRNRSAISWALAAFFLSPLLVVIVLYFMPALAPKAVQS